MEELSDSKIRSYVKSAGVCSEKCVSECLAGRIITKPMFKIGYAEKSLPAALELIAMLANAARVTHTILARPNAA
jgi:hypothetical protein